MTRIAAQMMTCVALAITELYAIHAAVVQNRAPARSRGLPQPVNNKANSDE
jgi:hypothetical protein